MLQAPASHAACTPHWNMMKDMLETPSQKAYRWRPWKMSILHAHAINFGGRLNNLGCAGGDVLPR